MPRLLGFFLIICNWSFICRADPAIGTSVRLAKEKEFPFIVSISYDPKSGWVVEGAEERGHICGGALITPRHVLTAAHCVEHVRCRTDIIVKVGSVDWRGGKQYKVKKWITYERWAGEDRNTHPYCDVAIVTLETLVFLKTKLPTISCRSDKSLYGERAVTAGWGLMDDDEQPRYMRVSKLEVLEPEECPFDEIGYFAPFRRIIPKIYMCSKWDPPTRLRCGDSGSPLLINNNTEIIGVNTNCWPASGVEMSEYRNLHADVNYFRNFLVKTTGLIGMLCSIK